MSRSLTLLDDSFEAAAENLALDDALLEGLDSGTVSGDILRFWESPEYAVVLGISGKISEEVKVEECQSASLPILRRGSGGGTVLIGPGCLNYSLILSFENWPQYRNLTHSYRDLLARVGASLGARCKQAGTSDLIQGDHKFSGNAQRRLQNAFIHHGTLLYDFDLAKVGQFLKEPPKQPAYRAKRPHSAFIRNLPLSRDAIKDKLRRGFKAELDWEGQLPDFQSHLIDRYLNSAWNWRR